MIRELHARKKRSSSTAADREQSRPEAPQQMTRTGGSIFRNHSSHQEAGAVHSQLPPNPAPHSTSGQHANPLVQLATIEAIYSSKVALLMDALKAEQQKSRRLEDRVKLLLQKKPTADASTLTPFDSTPKKIHSDLRGCAKNLQATRSKIVELSQARLDQLEKAMLDATLCSPPDRD